MNCANDGDDTIFVVEITLTQAFIMEILITQRLTLIGHSSQRLFVRQWDRKKRYAVASLQVSTNNAAGSW